MKKLYALLLLGSLLLLGTTHAWADADTYTVVGVKALVGFEWTTTADANDMTDDNGDGTYVLERTIYISSGDYEYKIVKNHAWGTGEIPASGNQSLNIPADGWYDITFTATPATPAASATAVASATHSVTVNVSGTSGATHLYAFVSYNDKYNVVEPLGAWPGTALSADMIFTVPEAYDTKLIIDKYEDSETKGQTPDIYLGSVTSDKSYSFNLSALGSFNSLKGDFNGWTDEHVFPSTDQVTVTLKAGVEYNYQITNVYRNSEDSYKTYWTWYGLGVATTMLPNTAHEVSWYFGGSADCGILTTVEGDYTFALSSWSEGKPSVTVTYPTTYERDLAIGAYGTICLPVDATVAGATLYTIKEISGGKLVITEAGTSLTKGTPYIYKATAATQTFTLDNSSYDGTAAAAVNGLVGKYADFPFAGSGLSLVYVVLNNSIAPASEESGVKGNRAFIKLDQVPGYTTSAPSALRITEEENNTTNINAINASEEVVKFFQNGKLFIQKNGVVYDMMGTIVK